MERVTLFAVVEGQSESGFFRPFLAEHLALRGIDLHVPVIGKGGAKGGMLRSFDQVCAELGNFLADRRRPWVTTFFDYYGLPTGAGRGWDFVPITKARGGVAAIEDQLRDGVRKAAEQRAERFIPYVQMHELEGAPQRSPSMNGTPSSLSPQPSQTSGSASVGTQTGSNTHSPQSPAPQNCVPNGPQSRCCPRVASSHASGSSAQ